MVVPESLTLQGISNKINCTIALASRILIQGENDGYIYRTKSKVINGKRKQYTFFLTDKGIKLAKEILENFECEHKDKINRNICDFDRG